MFFQTVTDEISTDLRINGSMGSARADSAPSRIVNHLEQIETQKRKNPPGRRVALTGQSRESGMMLQSPLSPILGPSSSENPVFANGWSLPIFRPLRAGCLRNPTRKSCLLNPYPNLPSPAAA